MLIKIAPRGEELLNQYKEYVGKTRGVVLVDCLEAVAKKDKGFQKWLKQQDSKPEPSEKPALKSVKTVAPMKEVKEAPDPEPSQEPTPVPRKHVTNSLENELR